MSFRNHLLLALLALPLLARGEIKAGDAFPALESAGLVNLAGTSVPATAGRIVLVDFWASWCAPCKASFPAMGKVHADYASRGFEIVAVSVDDKPAAATAFWKKMAAPFVGLHDPQKKLVQQVEVPTMPTSYLLDRAGKVRFVHVGFHGDSSVQELRKQIDALLAENP